MDTLPAGYDAWRTAGPKEIDYWECDGCGINVHIDSDEYWDHTEGENGLGFHSEDCALNHTISQVELYYNVELGRK